jgi:serine/threonine-protein phosphatase PGAM5
MAGERRMRSRFVYLMRHGEADPSGLLTSLGELQSRCAGDRLAAVPLAAIWHSPQLRAASTAAIVAAHQPGPAAVPVGVAAELDDYVPSDPDPVTLPPAYARFLAAQPAGGRAAGARLAAAAIGRFGCPPGPAPAPGQGEAGASSPEHVLLVTYSFQVGWFVRDALDAPAWRWLGLNAQNAALTIIRYQAGLPAALISFNDAGHLAGPLRWTGFPDALRPASG